MSAAAKKGAGALGVCLIGIGLTLLCACPPGPGGAATSAASAANATLGTAAAPGLAASANATASTLPNMAGAQGSLTLAPGGAPDLCLALTGGNGEASSLVLRTCDASWTQRWVLVSGLLQSAVGTCLTLDANASLSASNVALAACDPNAASQHVYWQGGRITIGLNTGNYALQPDGAPPSTRSAVQFAPLDVKSSQQQWTMGQFGHDDASRLIVNGTHIVPLDARTTCVTATSTDIVYAPCTAGDGNQAWLFTATSRVQNGDRCLHMVAGTPGLAPCSVANMNQVMTLGAGLLSSPTNQCLSQDEDKPGVATLEMCSLSSSRMFAVGLSQ